jgi:hypothetical protein
MVGTIGSIGHGATGQRKTRWRRLLAMYALGAVLSGAIGGAILGLTGLALDSLERNLDLSVTWANATGALLLVWLALRDLGVLKFRIPSRHRQVAMAWKLLPGYWSPFVFGFSLGAGIFTTIYLASFYSVVLLAILVRNFALSVIMGVLFAVSRAVPIVISAWLPAEIEVDDFIAVSAPRTPQVARINGLMTAVVALVLLSAYH